MLHVDIGTDDAAVCTWVTVGVAVLQPKHMGLSYWVDSLTPREDQQFVDGELKVARRKLSLLGTSTDAEFRTNKNWKDLGGTGRIVASELMTDEAPRDGVKIR